MQREDKTQKANENELSEQDQALSDHIGLLCERVQRTEGELSEQALDELFNLILDSRKTRTQIPKELKFL